jgi:hypothetical protein
MIAVEEQWGTGISFYTSCFLSMQMCRYLADFSQCCLFMFSIGKRKRIIEIYLICGKSKSNM